MSESIPPKQSALTPPGSSLLHSDLLLRILGGDALQLLKCGICTKYFDVPIVLPCGHSFCLQCLTEMCRQAGVNNSGSSSQDQRIGCPKCRVLIYATPILDHNVTCNYAIQSFVENLKTKKIEQPITQGTNTDESRLGSKIRCISDIELQKVSMEMDRLSESLGKHNVLDNAYFEVEQIRREFLKVEEARKKEEDQQQSRQRAWSADVKTPQFYTLEQQQQQQQKEQPQEQSKANQLRFPQPRQNPFGWSLFNPQTHSTATTPTSNTTPVPLSLLSPLSSTPSSPSIASVSTLTAPCHQLQSDILNGIRKQISNNLHKQQQQKQQLEQKQQQKRRQTEQQRMQFLKKPISPRQDQPLPSSLQWFPPSIQQQTPSQQQKQGFPYYITSDNNNNQFKLQPKLLGHLHQDKQKQEKTNRSKMMSASDMHCSTSSNLNNPVSSLSGNSWSGLIEHTEGNKMADFLLQSKHPWSNGTDISKGVGGSSTARNMPGFPETWSFRPVDYAVPSIGSTSSRPTSHLDQDPAVMTYSYQAASDKTVK